MKKSRYTKTMDQIKADPTFNEQTKQLLHEALEKENQNQEIIRMKNIKNKRIYQVAVGLAACCALIVGGVFAFHNQPTEIQPTNPPIQGKAVVNIEGEITEVSEDGQKIKVDDLWVIITEDTEMGITGPNAAPKDEQFFDDEFKVGNSIAGFTLDDPSSGEVTAYAIYTNWNWDN